MATIAKENIGTLHDKLTVKVSKEDYMPNFEKKLKQYGKTANVPGFRKGMVPAGVIKKMYGEGVFQEEVLRSVDAELNRFLTEEKPNIFGQPLGLENDVKIDLKDPKEYEFHFDIGQRPDVNIADVKDASLTLQEVEVTDAMVDEEVEQMRERAGVDADKAIADNEMDGIELSFVESEKVETGEESKKALLILKNFSASVKKEIEGQGINTHFKITVDDAFISDADNAMLLKEMGLDNASSEGLPKSFNVEITAITEKQKSNLDDAFFQKIFPGKEIADEAAFKKELKAEIQSHWDAQSKNMMLDELYHYVLDETKMEFPEAFLKRLMRFGTETAKSEEEAEAEYPTFSKQLKWTLISDKIAEENKLEVSAEEVRESLRKDVMGYFGQMGMGDNPEWLDSYIDRMMQDKKQLDQTYQKLSVNKVFDYLESQTSPVVQQISMEDFKKKSEAHKH